MKRNRKSKGFTLAELLIVVAIIAVLVAIAIPIFTEQLEKSREAVDLANLRGAYAEVMVEALTDNDTAVTQIVDLKQTKADWETGGAQTTLNDLTGGHVTGAPADGAGGKATVEWLVAEQCVQITFDGTGGGSAVPRYIEGTQRKDVMVGFCNALTDILRDGYQDNPAYTVSMMKMRAGPTTVNGPEGSFTYREFLISDDYMNQSRNAYWTKDGAVTYQDLFAEKGITTDQLASLAKQAGETNTYCSVYLGVGDTAEESMPVSISFIPEDNPGIIRYIYLDTGNTYDIRTSELHTDGMSMRHYFAYNEAAVRETYAINS